MRYYGMESALVEIYQIRNIESIKIWDMVQTNHNKMLVIPALFLLYDGGKQINLCAKDKYFDVYVKKVVQVYQDEKNNILEDSLTDPFQIHRTISIDEHTKQILESGTLEEVNPIYSFYQGKESYTRSLFFQKDEVHALISIVKYHINKFFNQTESTIIFTDELEGYRNHYYLGGTIDGIEHYFPLTFEKLDTNHFLFKVSGLVNPNVPLEIKISFLKDSIHILLAIDSYGIQLDANYMITNGVIKEILDIKRNGITIAYENKDLEGVDDNPLLSIASIDHVSHLKWFQLPWQAFYGFSIDLETISETEKVIGIQNMYLDLFANGFMKKEYYSKNYKRNSTVSLYAEDMLLEEIRKTSIGLAIDKKKQTFVIETSFDENESANAFFNGTYGGKYFYHGVFSEEGISGIQKEMLVELNRKQSIIENSDLINKEKILKLVKGE